MYSEIQWIHSLGAWQNELKIRQALRKSAKCLGRLKNLKMESDQFAAVWKLFVEDFGISGVISHCEQLI